MFKAPSSRRHRLGILRRFGHACLSQGTLRIGMTAADIPLTPGQPDQGFEGFRFAGYTLRRSRELGPVERRNPDRHQARLHRVEGEADNPKKWIFKLPRGVKFHDGMDFNADAVIWNLGKVAERQVAAVRPQADRPGARGPNPDLYRLQEDRPTTPVRI